MKRIIILGGGTFNPIRNHLSLAAPAFGTTAKNIWFALTYQEIKSEIKLTKMADSESKLMSNQDVSDYIDTLLDDPTVGTIVMNVALCDFEASYNGVEGDFHGERIHSRDGDINITLTPADKLISRIKVKRPDIFLVGFKTITGKHPKSIATTAKDMINATDCDVVFANDVVNRTNMIVTKFEIRDPAPYWTHERDSAVLKLVDYIVDEQ
jgi:hypothetical protein